MAQTGQAKVGGFVRISQSPWKDFGVGKLVSAKAGIGVVRFLDHLDDPNPSQVGIPLVHIHPVQLPPQTRVYWLDETTSRWQVGRVLDGEGSTLLIQFPNKKIANVPDSELEIRWRQPIANLISFLARQVTETPRFSDSRSLFMNEVTRQRAATLGMSAILSSSIQLTDYQYKVIKRVLQDPVQRYLLADEVGLGKTIEAGVLIRQFILDNPQTAKVLVVVPASLVDQWRGELIRKFNLDVWLDESLCVVASDDIRQLEKRIADAEMLVIDEAHHLSTDRDEKGVSLFGLVSQYAPSVAALLLLSATPALADTRGFLKMLHLLDPVVFRLDDLDGFKRRIESRQLIAELVSRLVPENALVMEDDLDRLVVAFNDDALLQVRIEHLRPIVQRLPEEDDEEFVDALEAVRIHIAETYKLHRRILRNRRRSFPWATPKRSGLRRVVYGCDLQQQRQAAIEELRLMLVNDSVTGQLSQFVLQHAIQPTCDDLLEQVLRFQPGVTSEHLAQSSRVDALSRRLREQESRLKALSKEIQIQLRVPQVQVTVFCNRSQTADEVFESLQALLRDQVVRHQVRNHDEFGDLDPDSGRLESHDWRRFMREPEGCRVIVCDHTAEEGLNLHGGRKVVIHFDFPMSPNRVEQRIGRFDRFGSGSSIESVAILCSDDPNEIAWADCLERGFEVFEQSLASLQYLVDEVMQSLPQRWMEKGTTALVETGSALAGPEGRMSRERRRIDQQDTLDSLGARPDDGFEDLEAVDDEWRSWGVSFRELAETTLQLGRVPLQWQGKLAQGDEVFRTRYSMGGNAPTLFPLSVFVTDFIGTLDTDAPGASSRNLLSFPYSLRRNTALSKDGQARRVRPLRFGDPLVEALLSFCHTDDRGRVFAVWRHWPDYSPVDACGNDLFFRFDFLVEADLGGEDSIAGSGGVKLDRALRRRVDGCFAPQFVTVWIGVDNMAIAQPTEHLTTPYRSKPASAETGQDFNLNPSRWQQLSTREDVPWLLDWERVCQRAHEDALAHVSRLGIVQVQISKAQRLLNEQLKTRTAYLHNRIARLSSFPCKAEEAELVAELDRHERLMAAVTRPRFHLDVVGAVFVSANSFEAS
jgi:ATP-dependent helicase HepA